MILTDDRLSWAQFDKAAKNMVKQINESGLHFDSVLGVARGGLILAEYLAYHLKIKAFYSTNTRLYKDQTLVAPEILYFPSNVALGNVLVVDDILDSGNTYTLLEPKLLATADEFSWAILIDKGISKIKVDFVGFRLESPCWVHFPWAPT